MCDIMKQGFPQPSWEWHRVDSVKRQNNNKYRDLTLNGEHIDFHSGSFQKFQIISCTDRELWTKELSDISDGIFTPKFKKTVCSLRSYANGHADMHWLDCNGRASWLKRQIRTSFLHSGSIHFESGLGRNYQNLGVLVLFFSLFRQELG